MNYKEFHKVVEYLTETSTAQYNIDKIYPIEAVVKLWNKKKPKELKLEFVDQRDNKLYKYTYKTEKERRVAHNKINKLIDEYNIVAEEDTDKRWNKIPRDGRIHELSKGLRTVARFRLYEFAVAYDMFFYKDGSLTVNEIQRTIDNEELFKLKEKLDISEFVSQFNKSLIEYVQSKINDEKNLDIYTKDNELDKIKKRLLSWFTRNGIPVDSVNSFIDTTEKLKQDIPQKPKASEIKKEILKVKDAERLLEKLKGDNHQLTKEDKKIIKHGSFKIHRSKLINSLTAESFDEAFNQLNQYLVLTHEDFYNITKPPSQWYKKYFFNSFCSHCENSLRGKYYERLNGRKLNSKVKKVVAGKEQLVFTLI